MEKHRCRMTPRVHDGVLRGGSTLSSVSKRVPGCRLESRHDEQVAGMRSSATIGGECGRERIGVCYSHHYLPSPSFLYAVGSTRLTSIDQKVPDIHHSRLTHKTDNSTAVPEGTVLLAQSRLIKGVWKILNVVSFNPQEHAVGNPSHDLRRRRIMNVRQSPGSSLSLTWQILRHITPL